MAEHDELLARADRWVQSTDCSLQTAAKLVRELAAALRAALATQPQDEVAKAVVRRLWDGWRPLPRKAQWIYTKPGYRDDERETMTEAERAYLTAVAGSATPTRRDEAGNEWVTPPEDMWPDCTCVPGEGCDAEGDPGCRYCQTVDPEWPCPADDDAAAGSATPTDWEEEGRKAAAEGLTAGQAAERFGQLVAGSATPTGDDHE